MTNDGDVGYDERPTLLPVWWDCKPMQLFLINLRREIEQTVKFKMQFPSNVLLLHDFRSLTCQMFNILLAHMLIDASLLIAGYWNSITVLLLLEWRQKMYFMF